MNPTINPLLQPQFRIPFDEIRPEHIEPAIKELITLAESRLEVISSPQPRTYANTLGALDNLSDELDFALNVARHLESVATTPEHRAAFNAAEPRASAFYSRVPLHAGVWLALKEFAASDEGKALTGVRKRFLEKTVRSFRKQGADLPADKKAELEAIDVELTKVTTKFAENVLDSTNAWEWVTTNESDLAGLPEMLIQMGTADLLLWDCRKFYMKCLDAGVSVKYEEYPDAFHDFMMLSPLPEAKRALRSQAEFLSS